MSITSTRTSLVLIASGLVLGLVLIGSGWARGLLPTFTNAQAAEPLGVANPVMQQISQTETSTNWAAVPDADEYTLDVFQGAEKIFTNTSTTLARKVTLPITTPGTTYQYSVTATHYGPVVTDPTDPRASTTTTPKDFTTRADKTAVRFGIYNVCAEHCPGLQSWSTRVKGVTATVKSRMPDVLTVQEAGGSRQLASLTSHLKSIGYARAQGGSARFIYYRTSTMSISAYDGSAQYGYTTHVRYRDGKNQAIPLQLFRQRATNARVLVVGYHLLALDGTSRDVARLSEFKQVSSKISKFRKANPSIPVVKAGDFNSLLHKNTSAESDSARWRVYYQARSDGFKDARANAKHTSNANLSSINQMPSDHRRFPKAFQLDHFFVQNNAIVTSWGLLNRNVSYKYQYSDHDMTWANVVLPSR